MVLNFLTCFHNDNFPQEVGNQAIISDVGRDEGTNKVLEWENGRSTPNSKHTLTPNHQCTHIHRLAHLHVHMHTFCQCLSHTFKRHKMKPSVCGKYFGLPIIATLSTFEDFKFCDTKKENRASYSSITQVEAPTNLSKAILIWDQYYHLKMCLNLLHLI